MYRIRIKLGIIWKYGCYLIRHKWYVLIASFFTKAPLWLVLKHDLSKLCPIEFYGYSQYLFLVVDEELVAKSWLHHQNSNKHHWEYWISRSAHVNLPEVEGELLLPMPEKYVREMVSDWLAARYRKTGSWDLTDWLKEHSQKMRFHDITRKRLKDVLMQTCGKRVSDMI